MTIDGGDFLGRTARSVSGRSQSDCALLVAAGKADRPVALTLSHPLSCPLCWDAEAVDAAPVAFISVVSIDARALGDRVPPVHRRALRTPQQIADECRRQSHHSWSNSGPFVVRSATMSAAVTGSVQRE